MEIVQPGAMPPPETQQPAGNMQMAQMMQIPQVAPVGQGDTYTQ